MWQIGERKAVGFTQGGLVSAADKRDLYSHSRNAISNDGLRYKKSAEVIVAVINCEGLNDKRF